MDNKQLDKYIIDFMDGNEDSFDIIYEETKKSVYLSIYTLTKNKQVIEDLMQDTYLKAINSLKYYSIGTNFRAWISTIARNLTLNYLKRKNREELIDPYEREDLFKLNNDNHYLDFALSVLEGYEKEIIIYRVILDMKFKEIANIISLPLGTVYWHYRNALRRIRKEVYDAN